MIGFDFYNIPYARNGRIAEKNNPFAVRDAGNVCDRFHHCTLTLKSTVTLSPGARSLSGNPAAGSYAG